MLGFKFAKSYGWLARCWRSQTTGSATGTCNATVNSVNGNAKIFRRYADRQTLGQHQTDGRLSKLTGINSHRGHETRSFWRDQTRQFLVSTKSGEVQCLVHSNLLELVTCSKRLSRHRSGLDCRRFGASVSIPMALIPQPTWLEVDRPLMPRMRAIPRWATSISPSLEMRMTEQPDTSRILFSCFFPQ